MRLWALVVLMAAACSEPSFTDLARKQKVPAVEITEVERLAGATKLLIGTTEEVTRPPRPTDGGRPILMVWNGIPLPEPDQPFVKGLPARSGSATGLDGVWSVNGVAGARVLKTREGKTHGRLRVTVEKGRVRAYLEYLGGFHVLCEAAPDRPCEVIGSLYAGSRSSTSNRSMSWGPTNFEVVIESLEGDAKGLRFEFEPR